MTEAASQVNPTQAGFRFERRHIFWWKTAYLTVVTIAFIPILLSKHEMAATWYVVGLVVIHLASLVVFAVGVRREDVAPSKRGFYTRLLGLAAAIGLLYLASQGLRTEAGALIFWGSLFAIWFIHTAALALLHIRGPREGDGACPFV